MYSIRPSFAFFGSMIRFGTDVQGMVASGPHPPYGDLISNNYMGYEKKQYTAIGCAGS